MDTIDLKIIEILKENSRATASMISKEVNLSISAVAERLKRMEKEEIIEKYTIKLNRAKLNYSLVAFIFVNIDNTENVMNFQKLIMQYDCVLECHRVSDEYDYFLKVLVENTKSLEYFLSNILKRIRGVSETNTIISLSSLKEDSDT